jgi:hypothetical protein
MGGVLAIPAHDDEVRLLTALDDSIVGDPLEHLGRALDPDRTLALSEASTGRLGAGPQVAGHRLRRRRCDSEAVFGHATRKAVLDDANPDDARHQASR